MTLVLSTFCAQKGICSKRNAKKFIQLGYIKVNNQVVKQDILVKKTLTADRITLVKRIQDVVANKISVLLHKPEKILSTFTRGHSSTWAKSLLIPQNRCEHDVQNALNPSQLRKLVPINPLEYSASGLTLFSEDRTLVSKYKECEEEYHVIFKDVITRPKLFVLRADVHIDGIPLPPLKVTQLSEHAANITIHNSSNKLRKACLQAGLEIRSLKRIRMANIQLGNTLCGQWMLLKRYQLT